MVLNVAYRLRVTYYDASYIVISYEVNADLVTDYEKLKKRAKEGRKILLEHLGKEVTMK